MDRPKKSIRDRMIEANERCGHWLAEANEAEERGDHEKANRLYEKSGFWRDRYNKLAGNS